MTLSSCQPLWLD
jgi:hypothetical protein